MASATKSTCHDIDLVFGAEWKHRAARRGTRKPSPYRIAWSRPGGYRQHDADPGRKIVSGVSGSSTSIMCSQKFFRSRIRIVVGAIPTRSSDPRDNFVFDVAGDCNRADFAEPAQPMIMLGMTRQREHFQRSRRFTLRTSPLRLRFNDAAQSMTDPWCAPDDSYMLRLSPNPGRSEDRRRKIRIVSADTHKTRRKSRCNCMACHKRACASCLSRARTSRFKDAPCPSSNSRPRARRYIQSPRSGDLPRCSVGPSPHGVAVGRGKVESCGEAAPPERRPSIKG